MTPTITARSTPGTATSSSPSDTFTVASPLSALRGLIPQRTCQAAEALQIAERQATRLVELFGGSDNLTPATLSGIRSLRIVFEDLPVSGMSYWDGHGRTWVIAINQGDSPARQRFTLLHEYKHVIDHGATDRLYRDTRHKGRVTTASEHAEHAADYFAGCALVTKRDLKRAWTHGLQRRDSLADHFGVSVQAIEVRLDQTGIARVFDPDPVQRQRPERCARPISTPTWQPQRFRTVRPFYARGRSA